MKILLAFATLLEAEAMIKRLNAKLVGADYHCDLGLIVITGMGVHAAQSAVQKHIGHCDEVWSFGIAGALNPELTSCQLVSVGKVSKYVPVHNLDDHSRRVMESHLPPIQLDGDLHLITSDFPIHGGEHKPNADLVDMEGYGIAYIAKLFKRPCRMWKVVSDFAAEGGPELIQKNLKICSEKLAFLGNGMNCGL